MMGYDVGSALYVNGYHKVRLRRLRRRLAMTERLADEAFVAETCPGGGARTNQV